MIYILKSSLGLLVLIGFYYVFLEREKAFVFNRIYLLTAMVFSLVMPLLTLRFSFDWSAVFNQAPVAMEGAGTQPAVLEKSHDPLMVTLISVYALGFLVMTTRFFMIYVFHCMLLSFT